MSDVKWFTSLFATVDCSAVQYSAFLALILHPDILSTYTNAERV